MKTIKDYGVEHIGFVVKDLKATIEAFKQIYDLESCEPYDFSPTRAWSYGKEIADYKLKIAVIKTDHSGDFFEIIQPLSGEGVHKDFIEAGNTGLHHIAFKVDNYDYWRKYFADKGANFVFESETEDELVGYRRCFYADDKELGLVYEIKESPYFRK